MDKEFLILIIEKWEYQSLEKGFRQDNILRWVSDEGWPQSFVEGNDGACLFPKPEDEQLPSGFFFQDATN